MLRAALLFVSSPVTGPSTPLRCRSVDDGEDAFVHDLAIDMDGNRSLEEGQPVQFEISQGPKGSQADSVRAL